MVNPREEDTLRLYIQLSDTDESLLPSVSTCERPAGWPRGYYSVKDPVFVTGDAGHTYSPKLVRRPYLPPGILESFIDDLC